MNQLSDFFVGEVYTPENNNMLHTHREMISFIIPHCADNFYRVLLQDKATERFLSSQLVEDHLRLQLQGWLFDTLTPKNSEPARLQLINKHRHVGEVHARIDVPMQLVNSAMSIIKRVLFEHVKQSQLDGNDKADLIILLNQLLDASMNLINESFLEDHVRNERSAQEYRSRSSAHELAIEIERVKGALFGWMTQFMADMLTTKQRIIDIHHQEFSLWIRHKLSFVGGPDDQMVRRIKHNLDQLQTILTHLYEHPEESREQSIQMISALTNECGWLLGQIADQHIESAAREDALTSLIERRFLAPIMQNETQMAMKTNTPYSLMMIDVDNFKSVNDIHGHQAGDAVLSSIGRTLKRSLRVTDYAFRYGGEEFMILMPETVLASAERAAEKLLEKVRSTSVTIDNNRTLKVTISIGIAEFSGHPDFEQVIKYADEKLYQAKHNGKDRYER